MTCAVLSIGTELTRGELVNSNSAWLSAALTDLGFEVTEQVGIDDEPRRIVETFQRLTAVHEVVVSTGGLGPTTDDLTTQAVARALGVGLRRDEASLDQIRRRLEKFGRVLTDSNAKQSDFPEGATILPNPLGTAPGFEVQHGRGRAFFLPGVPREMMNMFEQSVVPAIRDLAPNDAYQVRFHLFGLPESLVGERLSGVEGAFPGVTLGYRAHFPEIQVKVLARAENHGAAQALAEKAAHEVRGRLADAIYGEGDDTFAGVVGRTLRTRGHTLAIAESCTGGLVGSLLTQEPGASDFLLLDAVTYANSAKQRVLGIDEEVLRGHGAVSPEVAVAMAEGARRVSGASLALAITGTAGPNGGTDAKPVGTVYLAVATAKRPTLVEERRFPGGRRQIQTLAAYAGLSLVRQAALSG